jgi:hypothetical protein
MKAATLWAAVLRAVNGAAKDCDRIASLGVHPESSLAADMASALRHCHKSATTAQARRMMGGPNAR